LKKIAISIVLACSFAVFSAQPGYSVSKEIISMMQQLDTLQQQMQALEKTVDSQTAVLKVLVQQTNDKVTSMQAAVEKMQTATQKSLAVDGNRFDAMTSQIQQLSASVDETKARLSKLSDQLAQTQRTLETLNAPPAQAGAAQGGGAQAPPGSQVQGPSNNTNDQAAAGKPATPATPAAAVPDPETLYNSAYSDYTNGNYDLAIQGFQQYLQNYGQTDLASNAQFYIGDAYYLEKKYTAAIKAYDQCITEYPGGNKMQAARLKKGYALLAEGHKSAGVEELRTLVQRYPDSKEAELARERLRRVTTTSSGQG
jgi:tol-pal system protein YbgF